MTSSGARLRRPSCICSDIEITAQRCRPSGCRVTIRCALGCSHPNRACLNERNPSLKPLSCNNYSKKQNMFYLFCL